jgi:hypothetical protein
MQRGRKSAESLAILAAVPGQRPEPPAELTAEQAAEWRAIVGRRPVDCFTPGDVGRAGQATPEPAAPLQAFPAGGRSSASVVAASFSRGYVSVIGVGRYVESPSQRRILQRVAADALDHAAVVVGEGRNLEGDLAGQRHDELADAAHDAAPHVAHVVDREELAGLFADSEPDQFG